MRKWCTIIFKHILFLLVRLCLLYEMSKRVAVIVYDNDLITAVRIIWIRHIVKCIGRYLRIWIIVRCRIWLFRLFRSSRLARSLRTWWIWRPIRIQRFFLISRCIRYTWLTRFLWIIWLILAWRILRIFRFVRICLTFCRRCKSSTAATRSIGRFIGNS